MADLRIC